MSVKVRTCKKYQVEHADPCIYGWENAEKFIKFLRKKSAEGTEGIWISENEEDIEISFDTLNELKNDPVWGKQIESIIEDADKTNDFARLEIY